MKFFRSFQLFASFSLSASARSTLQRRAVVTSLVDTGNSSGSLSPVLPAGFVAFSIELAFFPDYAGNTSNPNNFSDNLLNNLRDLQGTKPHIRVGGNTQDVALFNASQETGAIGIIIPSVSEDNPAILTIGPSFFESYAQWPGTRFSHGFNLAGNDSEAHQTLVDTAPLACEALGIDKLYHWELGNEADLYKPSKRPENWTEVDYVAEWKNKTAIVQQGFQQACPDVFASPRNNWMAPSFAGIGNSLDPLTTWEDGLDTAHNIALNTEHNYMGVATQPGITLQGTLMNHSNVMRSADVHIPLMQNLSDIGIHVPYILGETNSIAGQGTPGVSNTFGAALWGVDFNLYCASIGILRTHMHQGTSFRYQSWQPVETNTTTKGTKAPYYGNIAVAAMMGNMTDRQVQIKNIPLERESESAYAAYVDGLLKRVMVINMDSYNFSVPDPTPRPTETYSFQLPQNCSGTAVANFLLANGSDAISGITFNGVSYNWELDNGKPVVLANVTRNEQLDVSNGTLDVVVPHSAAAMVHLDC